MNEGEEIQYGRFTVSDSGRRQNCEIQHSVTMDSMYSKLTTGAWQEINNKPWRQTVDFRQHRDENYDNRREQIIKTISEMDSRQ